MQIAKCLTALMILGLLLNVGVLFGQKSISMHYWGVTRQYGNKEVLSANVKITELGTNIPVFQRISGNQGVIKTKLTQGKRYTVHVSAGGYVSLDDTIMIDNLGVVSSRTDTFFLKRPQSNLPMITFEGRVFDRATNKRIISTMEGERYTSKIDHFIYEEGADTTYSFQIIAFKRQEVTIRATGYLPQVFEFTPTDYVGEKKVSRDFYLTKIVDDGYSVLSQVFFVQSSPDIVSGSEKELKDLAMYLKTNPLVNIELAGHTDNVGAKDLNQKLSEERVKRVTDYLVEKGVNVSRITGYGYGGDKPIASNQNAKSRRLNRRVEFKFTQ